MNNYDKEQQERIKYLRLIKIQNRTETDFKKGDTPAETLMYLHTSDIMFNHEQRLEQLENRNNRQDNKVEELSTKLEQKSTELTQQTLKSTVLEQQLREAQAAALKQQLEKSIGRTITDKELRTTFTVQKPTAQTVKNTTNDIYLHHYGTSYDPTYVSPTTTFGQLGRFSR